MVTLNRIAIREQLMGKKAAQLTTITSESAVSSAPVSTQERRVETQTSSV